MSLTNGGLWDTNGPRGNRVDLFKLMVKPDASPRLFKTFKVSIKEVLLLSKNIMVSSAY